LDSGFPELASKSESYEICFIPDNDYRGFLKRKEPEATAKLAPWLTWSPWVATVLGEHDGYPFFTIGQRKGLGIATGEPLYVTDIRPETNTVVLGRKDDLDRRPRCGCADRTSNDRYVGRGNGGRDQDPVQG
jgi:tRNA-specific 2-thiouridylase